MARTKRMRRLSIVSSDRAPSVSIDSSAVEDEQYDASEIEKIVGVANAEDRRKWPHPGAASFIRSSAGLEGEWLGIRPLGAGSFGINGLWEKRNEDGNVVDYMVIKETKGSLERWDPTLPDEVKIMKKMNKTHCRGVVRLRAYKRYYHKKAHRLYLRYCPYGDLRRLIDRYRRFRRYFPEAFLCEVFYYLMEAADAMANGPADKDWGFQVVHRDIKPDNIFLGSPYEDNDGIPYYPTARLGDFGVASECYLTDLDNPSDLLESGTRGWQAPEQLQTFHDVRNTYLKDPFIIYGHTNIWAIGAIMYELLTLRRVDPIWLREVADLHHGINPIITDQRPEYSRALKEAIRDCPSPYPRERPSVHPLLETIDGHRRVPLEDLSDEAGNRPTGSIPPGGNRLYYRGNEINKMPPGKWQPSADDEEKDPKEPDDGWHDPHVSPIKFPRFPDAAPPKKKLHKNKNKNLGRKDIVGETDEDAKRQAELKAVWNLWHARESGKGMGVKSVQAEAAVEEEEEDDERIIINHRQHRERNKLRHLQANLSLGSNSKRKVPQNDTADIEQEEENPGPTRTSKRQRGLKKCPTLSESPAESEEYSEDEKLGVGPEEGGQAEQSDGRGDRGRGSG